MSSNVGSLGGWAVIFYLIVCVIISQLPVSCCIFLTSPFLLHVVKLHVGKLHLSCQNQVRNCFAVRLQLFSLGELVYFFSFFYYFCLFFYLCLCNSENNLRLIGSLQLVSSLHLYGHYENRKTLKDELNSVLVLCKCN